MSRWRPCKRREFVRKLLALGFQGPYSGARHQFLRYSRYRLTLPHDEEYSVPQIKFLLREVEQIIKRKITIKEWDRGIKRKLS